MVRNIKGAIPQPILPLVNWFIELKRVDLYNKSRVMGDYQARFFEWLEVKFLRPTRRTKPLGATDRKDNKLYGN